MIQPKNRGGRVPYHVHLNDKERADLKDLGCSEKAVEHVDALCVEFRRRGYVTRDNQLYRKKGEGTGRKVRA